MHWIAAALAMTLSSIGTTGSTAANPTAQAANLPKKEQLVEAKAPPLTEGIFPCTQCHNEKVNGKLNPVRRELQFHDEIQADFHHDSENRWCLDCHDAKNRDVLHLTGGEPVPFTESYKLCGQCHGDKYRDWKRGVHGKRIGQWNGEKTYFLCVNCHNPHSPKFKPIKPLPPPIRPSEMKR